MSVSGKELTEFVKVLFCASEAAPFAKVGGLADVVGSLPIALSEEGVDARIILPKYKAMDESKYQLQFLSSVYVKMGWRSQYAGVFTTSYRGITVYFIDNEYYFGGSTVYGYPEGEAEKYAFFCRAVMETMDITGFVPDVLHCNDWQTGLLPVLLKTQYPGRDIRTVLTVHNLKFQGVFGTQLLKELMGFGDEMFTTDKLEFYGGASFLKGGLLYADKVTTVSPTYAKETLGSYYGERMEGILACRGNDYTGILNGIDYTEYDPQNDPLLPYGYSVEKRANKKRNKAALQQQLGLTESNSPLVAVVSRLYDQKGLDLIKSMLSELLFTLDFQLVVLGTGEKEYEEFFGNMASWFPGRVAAVLKYDNTMAHRIYGSADLFLMPSRFEPCGLSQLIAMRYGTPPVVRRTGGLNDTVRDAGDKGGWGFCFNNYNAHEMADALRRGLETYASPEQWRRVVRNAMKQDFSWKKSAKQYLELYRQLCGKE